MSKIKIKSVLKSKNGIHKYNGKGIKTNNKIIYNDKGILTTITLGKIIYLERKKDYYIKIGFNISKTVLGTYIIPEGKMKIKTKTKKIKQGENDININYSLYINDNHIDDFELNLQYSIDT